MKDVKNLILYVYGEPLISSGTEGLKLVVKASSTPIRGDMVGRPIVTCEMGMEEDEARHFAAALRPGMQFFVYGQTEGLAGDNTIIHVREFRFRRIQPESVRTA